MRVEKSIIKSTVVESNIVSRLSRIGDSWHSGRVRRLCAWDTREDRRLEVRKQSTFPLQVIPVSGAIVQMHTWKIGFYEFLNDRKVPGTDDGRCDCKQGKQTVNYVRYSWSR